MKKTTDYQDDDKDENDGYGNNDNADAHGWELLEYDDDDDDDDDDDNNEDEENNDKN